MLHITLRKFAALVRTIFVTLFSIHKHFSFHNVPYYETITIQVVPIIIKWTKYYLNSMFENHFLCIFNNA